MVSHYLCSVHSAFNSPVDVLTAVSRSQERVAVDPDGGKKENIFAAFSASFACTEIAILLLFLDFILTGCLSNLFFPACSKKLTNFLFLCCQSCVFSFLVF